MEIKNIENTEKSKEFVSINKIFNDTSCNSFLIINQL